MATPIAFDLVNSESQNLLSFTNPFNGAFSSAGDGFQKYQRGVSATIPFSLLDDSLSIFPGDSLGIIDENNTDAFFGVTDTVNGDNPSGDDVDAEWVFEISGAADLNLSIDMGAMGDFESGDIFVWTYQIDNGPLQTAFASTVDESGSLTYTLSDGDSFTLDDPMLVEGTPLSNRLQTLTTALEGTGSQLTLTLTANTNGGDEAFAFQNIVIGEGEPTSAEAGILRKLGGTALPEGAEITASDPDSQRLFVVSGEPILQVLDLSDPENPAPLSPIDLSAFGDSANSVAVKNGLVAVAVEATTSTDPGQVVFLDADGSVLNTLTVGALPDMLTFTPDGSKVLVANEGEEDDGIDPNGSVSLIDLSGGVENLSQDKVTTLDFSAFNDRGAELQAQGVRIFPGKTVAEDVEPEFIAVSPDGTQAFVTLQENNAVGVIDLESASVVDILPLGVKDHSQGQPAPERFEVQGGAIANTLDASDEDGGINLQNWPVFGLFQPDAIAAFQANGMTFYVTANEGDSRDEDERIGELTLDPDAFPNAAILQLEENLGRLEVSNIDGDRDGDGDFDQLFAFGARSFSIWDQFGNFVYDSGDDFEQITAEQVPAIFNSEGTPDGFDSRSDNKGPEPEGITTGVINDRTYAFIGLERVGGVMVYEVTDPNHPQFVEYVPNAAGDLSPEGLTFVSAADSPNAEPLLIVANEESDTVAIYQIAPQIRISDIQGAGHRSPLVGQEVTDVPGIVTAVDSNGFYLQDPIPDTNEATSEGIFVFTGSAPTVSVGDAIALSGFVTEFIPGGAGTGNLSITEITSPGVTVLSSGNPLPPAVILGTDGRMPPTAVIDNDNFDPFDPAEDGIDFYEAVEGMRVTINDAIAVSGTNRFGEIFTVADNGANATGLSERGTMNISPEDFNPERIQVQFDSGILPGFRENVDVGDPLGDVTGVVGYGFGNFEVNVTETFTPTSAGLEPEASDLTPTADQLTVASYNVLNLDSKVEDVNLVDDNDPDEIDDDLGDGRFDAIAGQIVNNLNLPDIIGLQEIQDNNGAEITDVIAADETLQLLVDQIAAISGVDYAFIDNPFIGNETSGGQPGGNIRTAFLYNPERVDLVGGSVQTVTDPADQQTNPDNPFFDSRLPLAANFLFNGQEITVVNNHFSSKGGSSPLFGQTQPSVTNQPGSGQEDPEINGSLDERQAQAQAVKDFVDGILAEDSQANIVALGDFNEFEFISPLETLEGSLTNLTETLPENERYSFIFQGNSQSLDHILVSDRLAAAANPAFDIVHVNTEFAETDARASDHDPLLSRQALPVPEDVIWGTPDSERLIGTRNGETIFGRAGNDLIVGRRGDDTLWGGPGNDLLIGNRGEDTIVLAAGEGTDTVVGFKVGRDAIALAGNLAFEQLSIEQVRGSTVISLEDEILAVLLGVEASALLEELGLAASESGDSSGNVGPSNALLASLTSAPVSSSLTEADDERYAEGGDRSSGSGPELSERPSLLGSNDGSLATFLGSIDDSNQAIASILNGDLTATLF